MKLMLKALACAAAMTVSGNAFAQAVVVNNVAFTPGSVTGNLHSSQLNGDVGIGRFEFKGNFVGTGTAFDYFTYSVDLSKFVSIGNVNYTSYSVMPISALSTITTAKANALNALLTNATPLLNAAIGQNAINISAGVQMAVWEIMFETQASWSVTNSNSGFYVTTPATSTTANLTALTTAESLANTYLSNVASNTWVMNNSFQLQLLYSSSQMTQIYLAPAATAGVPEPATWALMLLGFGAVGGVLRRRSNVTARIRKNKNLTRSND